MSRRHGFTLVELSIVLVILGLLVGGVLTGQSLIRAAELRSITTQFNTYVTATQTFRDKYMAIPGDMPNATAYWTAAAAGASCVSTAGTGTQTCDGNGDGLLLPSATSNEPYRFWQQLANAGLIEGTYSGIAQGSTPYSSTKQNAPAARLNSGLWVVYGWSNWSGSPNYFNGDYGNAFMVGTITANDHPYMPLIKADEAYNIDVKMDDGKPALGKVTAGSYSSCTDTTDPASTTANYRLNSTAIACALMFRRAF